MLDAPEVDLLRRAKSTLRRGESGEMTCSPFDVEGWK